VRTVDHCEDHCRKGEEGRFIGSHDVLTTEKSMMLWGKVVTMDHPDGEIVEAMVDEAQPGPMHFSQGPGCEASLPVVRSGWLRYNRVAPAS
jgi:hypothetical protein